MGDNIQLFIPSSGLDQRFKINGILLVKKVFSEFILKLLVKRSTLERGGRFFKDFEENGEAKFDGQPHGIFSTSSTVALNGTVPMNPMEVYNSK